MFKFLRRVSVVQAIFIYIALSTFIYKINFLEGLQSVFSAFIAHEYLPLSKDYALLDTALLIMPIISYLGSFFKGVQLYGYFLFVATLFSGLLFLDVLYKIDKKFKKNIFLTGICSVILLIPNLIFLNITRITFILSIVFLLSYHFKLFSKWKLFVIYTVCLIFRIDLIVLLSIVYFTVDIFITNKIKPKAVFLVIFALSAFTVYNLSFSKYASEPFKTIYYNELDLLDRDNIDYENLNENQSLIVEMMKMNVIDELLFKQEFIDSILYSKSSFLTNVLFAPKLFLNVFKHSLDTFYHSIWLISFCVILILAQIRKSSLRHFLLRIFLLVFPLLICFYISLPDSFVFPYYSFFILFLIIGIKNPFQVSLIASIILMISIYNSRSAYLINNKISMQFANTMHRIKALQDTYGSPLIFENAFYSSLSFFNPNIHYRYSGNNQIVFFNIAFCQAFDNYRESWERYNCPNALSIKEKILTARKLNKPIFFTSKERYEAYRLYLKKRYSYNDNFDFVILE